MKIQKHASRKSKTGGDYFKFELILEKDLIEKAELKEGDELIGDASKHQIILRKAIKEAKNS